MKDSPSWSLLHKDQIFQRWSLDSYKWLESSALIAIRQIGTAMFREVILAYQEEHNGSFQGEDGREYTQVIKNASKQELLPIIRRLVKKNRTTIYADKWKSYDGLVLDGYKHKRINYSKTYSNRKGTHVNGIENFWSFTKRRMVKFNGVSRKTFLLHLKECEFRYNNKGDILKLLRTCLESND